MSMQMGSLKQFRDITLANSTFVVICKKHLRTELTFSLQLL